VLESHVSHRRRPDRAPSTPHRRPCVRLACAGALAALISGCASPAPPIHASAPVATQTTSDDPPAPWRVDEFLQTPEWLTIHGDSRVRYERINGQYHPAPGLDSKDQVIYQRTRVQVDARGETLSGTFEIMDSRQRLAGPGTRIGTGQVNTVDILQAFTDIDLGDLGDGDHRLRLGRETLDLGSRRLMARQRYGNAVRSYTGADWLRTGDDGSTTRAFWLMPVQVRPGDQAAILDNDHEYDTQSRDLQFYGVHHETPVADGTRAEVYIYGLQETDLDTRRRSLYTPGARLIRAPAARRVDYQIEMAVQFGDSRAAVGGRRLNHRADFQHASVGYTFDGDTHPRVSVSFDRASGDRNPKDGVNQRFDTLFGQPREYSPTTLWPGAQHSNLVSPAVKVECRPTEDSRTWLSYRAIRLDSAKDAFPSTGHVDPSGATGDDVASIVEAGLQVDVVPRSVRINVGGAYQFADDVLQDAPNSVRDRDSKYAYAEATWFF
jgi:hypothetical protein